jgi:hypothetical protein
VRVSEHTTSGAAIVGSMVVVTGSDRVELFCLRCGKSTYFVDAHPLRQQKTVRRHRCGDPVATRWTEPGRA